MEDFYFLDIFAQPHSVPIALHNSDIIYEYLPQKIN